MISMVLLLTLAADWPNDLTLGWTELSVTRHRRGEPSRVARLKCDPVGVWKVTSPWRGDADVDALTRLAVAIVAPAQAGTPPSKPGRVAFEVELHQLSARVRRLIVYEAALNQPIPVTVDGVAFSISPVEFSTKIPDPLDFAPPGLWVAAKNDAISIEVKGRRPYMLVGHGEDWTVADAGVPNHDLDDVVGVIVGRQAFGHPLGVSLKALGLDKPAATARLCTPVQCRDFKFGTAGGHYYALAPDSDPLELRDNDWKLLVEGPFAH